MKAIEFQNFSCHYKTKKDFITALSHLDLTVEEGELLVILGESGCGKSTLIKACLGLADYFEGDLYIKGKTIEDIDLSTGEYACVQQDISLYPNLTVYENIAFPLRLMKMPQADIDIRVKQMAMRLEIAFLLTRKPKQLSIGQQQRVAIARALIKEPEFVYFDEPFSNIDAVFSSELRKLIKKYHEECHPTVIFVTHDINEAFSLADRIAVLENGQLAEIGTPEEIISSPKSDLIRSFLAEKNTFNFN